MKIHKRLISFFIAILISLIILSKVSTVIHAQQITLQKEIIPSDLTLDFTLAQQNPSPDRQLILGSEIKKAEIVSTTRQAITVNPQDTFMPTVKVENIKDTISPNQTTSEQVVTIPVTVDINESGTPIPTSDGDQSTNNPVESTTIIPSQTDTNNNFVPGTTVIEPDDNAAPADNSTNPNLPAPASSDNNTNQQPVDTSATPSTQLDNNPQPQNQYLSPSSDTQQNTNTIPPENGVDNQAQPTPAPSSDNNLGGSTDTPTPAPSSDNNSGGSTDTPTP